MTLEAIAEVRLSDDENHIATHLGQLREASHPGNPLYGDLTGEQYNIFGMAGELAFCKIANAYPDLTTSSKIKPFDCKVRGIRVDVKATLNDSDSTHCTAPQWKQASDCDVYALLTGSYPIEDVTWRLYGFIRSDYLIHPDRLADHFGRGLCYTVHKGILSPRLDGDPRWEEDPVDARARAEAARDEAVKR